MKNIIKCFIFDLDGTLVDTYQANYRAYKEAFKILGVGFTNKQYKNIYGLRFDDWIENILPGADQNSRNDIKKNKSLFYKKYIDSCVLNTALVTFLKYVKNMSYATCLTTTASRSNATYLLDHLGLIKHFDFLVYGEDVSKPKPNPECFSLCFKKMKVKPTECIIFEDSEAGCEAAIKSGAKLIKIRNR